MNDLINSIPKTPLDTVKEIIAALEYLDVEDQKEIEKNMSEDVRETLLRIVDVSQDVSIEQTFEKSQEYLESSDIIEPTEYIDYMEPDVQKIFVDTCEIAKNILWEIKTKKIDYPSDISPERVFIDFYMCLSHHVRNGSKNFVNHIQNKENVMLFFDLYSLMYTFYIKYPDQVNMVYRNTNDTLDLQAKKEMARDIVQRCYKERNDNVTISDIVMATFTRPFGNVVAWYAIDYYQNTKLYKVPQDEFNLRLMNHIKDQHEGQSFIGISNVIVFYPRSDINITRPPLKKERLQIRNIRKEILAVFKDCITRT